MTVDVAREQPAAVSPPAAASSTQWTGVEPDVLDHLQKPRPRLRLATLFAALLAALLPLCWAIQIRDGMGVAGINRPVFWGFYIITFVFWIGISHAGTLISAILRVTGAEWRRPVTRCAEAVTVFALCVGGLFPLIHLGRPWIFFYMLPYPNDRMLWPNFRSPLMWDLVAITTYLTGSILYFAVPLLPDLALLRDRMAARRAAGAKPSWRERLLDRVSLGWRGNPEQWDALEQGIKILAVAIIPVAVSVHTIVSWDFAMTRVPGWKSTIFGPYFVVGAIYSGIAMLLIAMAILRRGLRLDGVLHDRLFNNLGLLFLAMTLFWGYFTFAEHLTTWYAGDLAEQIVHHGLMSGTSLRVFLVMVIVNVAIPLCVLPFRWGRRPVPLALVSCGVVLGMWLERWIIVIPSLSAPRLTFLEGVYRPSMIEIGILVGSAGLFLLLYLLFVQILPVVSVWEIREGREVARSGSAATAVARTSQVRLDGAAEKAEEATEVHVDVDSVLAATNDGSAEDLLEVRSSAPSPRLHARRTRLPVVVWSLVGALVGGLAAFSLARWTALDYPLPTGGMNVVSGPPLGIVTYEGAALGLILATCWTVARRVRRFSGPLGQNAIAALSDGSWVVRRRANAQAPDED